MAISIDGTGTISGVSVGGLPDGSVDNDTLATGIDAAKLTGALPAIDGSALTGIASSQWTTTGSDIYYTTGNVGINNTTPAISPYVSLNVKGGGSSGIITAQSSDSGSSVAIYSGNNSSDHPAILYQRDLRIGSTTGLGTTGYTERMRITSSGDLQFNSGYGSAAVAYGCRVWVDFSSNTNIRGDGNVSSITDNGVGDFTVNFTSALVDSSYATTTALKPTSGASSTNGKVVNIKYNQDPTTSNVRLYCSSTGGTEDFDRVCVAIFR